MDLLRGPTLLGDRKYSIYVLDTPDRLIGGKSDYGALSCMSRVQSCQVAQDCGRKIRMVMSIGREAGFPPPKCFCCLYSNRRCYYMIMQGAMILSLTDRHLKSDFTNWSV